MMMRYCTRALYRWLLPAGLLLCLLLQACTSTSSDTVLTDSDESPQRKRARIHYELALGYFQQGQNEVALDETKLAIKVDPVYVDAFNLQALTLWRMRSVVSAEDSFRKALSLDADNTAAQQNLAWFLCQNRRYVESFALFDRVLQKASLADGVKAWATLGLCQQAAGQNDKAEKSWLQAYQLDASNPSVAYQLALLRFARADYAGAQFLLRRLNASEAASADTLWLGLKVERQLQQTAALQALSNRLKQTYPNSPQANWLERGAFHEQ